MKLLAACDAAQPPQTAVVSTESPSRLPPTIAIVDSEQAFCELSADWNDLVQRCGASVFFRHEWFEAAWAWRKADATLFIMLARDQDKLIGIFPLILTQRHPGLRRIWCAELLTVPDTQACDLLIAPERSGEVIDAFHAALHRNGSKWDQLDLRYLPGRETAAHQLMAALTHGGYRCNELPQGPNLYVPLDGTWDAYYATRSRSLKKANNLAANRLKKLGQIQIDWITDQTSDATAVQRALDQTIDISQRSWKKDTGNSLDQPGPKGFISVLTQHAMRNGWLSLWLLSLDGKALAMEYQLRDADNVYALRADFDAECEEVSPGSHLMRTLLETLFGKQLQRYYMGPGENAYKTRWTAENVALYGIVAYGKTLRGRLAYLANEVIKPAARALRDRLHAGEAKAPTKDKTAAST